MERPNLQFQFRLKIHQVPDESSSEEEFDAERTAPYLSPNASSRTPVHVNIQ